MQLQYIPWNVYTILFSLVPFFFFFCFFVCLFVFLRGSMFLTYFLIFCACNIARVFCPNSAGGNHSLRTSHLVDPIPVKYLEWYREIDHNQSTTVIKKQYDYIVVCVANYWFRQICKEKLEISWCPEFATITDANCNVILSICCSLYLCIYITHLIWSEANYSSDDLFSTEERNYQFRSSKHLSCLWEKFREARSIILYGIFVLL